MKELATEVLLRTTLETESRVEKVAREQRLNVIREFYPNADPQRIERDFYPQILRPRIHKCFEVDVSPHIDYAKSDTDLDAAFLRCNGAVCRSFFSALLEPHNELLTGDFTQSLATVLDIYDALGQSEYCDELMQQWGDKVAANSATAIEIFHLALQELTSIEINQKLHLDWKPEVITRHIHQMQRELLFVLLGALHN